MWRNWSLFFSGGAFSLRIATMVHDATSVTSHAPRKKNKLIRPRGKRGGVKHRPKGKKASHTPTKHAELIAKYHTLEKQIARASPRERAALLAEQQALGGLQVYQDQSTTGGAPIRGGESGKWCVKILKQIWPLARPVRLLDVGAIAGTAYAKWPTFVHVTSIDLHPRADHVIQSDFFEYPIPSSPEDCFDLVGLSLVINFVGDLHKRGRCFPATDVLGQMLLHAHRYLRPGGYLYVVLPLACVTNSRYMTHDHFRKIVHACGYDVVENEDSVRLTRWLLQQRERPDGKTFSSSLTDVSPFWDGTVFKKRELQAGARRNNFCILVP